MLRRCLICAMTLLLIAGVWGSAWTQTPEELIAIRGAFDAALNVHDLDQMMTFWTDDVVFDYVAVPPLLEGKQQVRAFFEQLLQTFPDFYTTEGRVLASGNIVVVEHSGGGTHLGDLMGIAGTGNSYETPHMDILEFEGDKIKKGTTYVDVVSMMIQLGLMPAGALPPLEPSVEIPDPEATGLSPSEAAQEFISRFNTHDLSHHVKMVHTDAEILFMPIGVPMDRNGYVALLELYLLGFPDLVGDVMRVIELGDGWVVIETVFSGTHDGPYMGVPATGLPSQTRTAGVMRFDAEGLLTNEHFYFDSMKALMDIGAVPGPTTVLPTTWGQIKSLFQE